MNLNKPQSITFIVEAKITQTFVILEEDLTLDDIKEGFRNGTYITTIDYYDFSGKEEYICRVNDDGSLSRVARITSQRAEGDITLYPG